MGKVDYLDLIQRDHQVLWHPCSQMKDYEKFQPLAIASAKGSYLITIQGQRILDAISSWWCKNLGHGHPRLVEALCEQARQFEHVILANTTHEKIVSLSEALTQTTNQLKKVFYASDGSSAVEIALKLTCHARLVKHQPEKNLIMGLSNGYHGETLFALGVSDIGLYRAPYEKYLPDCQFIQSVPYVNSPADPLWGDAELACRELFLQLEVIKERLSAIILEPILQAAAGMLIYSQDFLARLKNWCQKNDVYLIADEIMTGFGRTGKFYAFEHSRIEPDLLCLGKGLTAGMLPFSAVLMTDEIYDLFYNDYESGQSFLHSHTHSGNALGVAVALECLNVMQEEKIVARAFDLQTKLHAAMKDVMAMTPCLKNLRGIGGVIAVDIMPATKARLGYQIYQEAIKLGALLRPIGNTLYWVPPLNISDNEITALRDITIESIARARVG